MAGLIGDRELAAYNGLFQIIMVLNCVFYGMQAASSIRIGYHVGASNREMAIYVMKITFYFGLTISAFVAILFICLRNFIGKLFTEDQ